MIRHVRWLLKTALGLLLLLWLPKQSQAQIKNDYKMEWNEIQELENNGQTKTALEKTQVLYEKILKDDQNPLRDGHLVKVLIYYNKYQASLEEDGLVKAIARFEQQSSTAPQAIKPLLWSMQAEMYDQFLLNNLYKFRDRTTTSTEFKQEDIRTWDVERITKKTYELYLKSVSDLSTRQFSLVNLDVALESGYAVEGYYPTLYDLLCHRALTFFESDKAHLTKPAYKFYLDQAQALGDAKTFLAYSFTTRDSLASAFQAIVLYQELLRFHLNDADGRAFLHFNLRRLAFARNKSILSDKDALYLSQLEGLAKQYVDQADGAEVLYLMALYYWDLGKKYKPSPTELYRWDLKKAEELAEEASKKFPSSYGGKNAANLLAELRRRSFEVRTENIWASKQNILFQLQFRNIRQAHWRLVSISKAEMKAYNKLDSEEKRMNFLRDLKFKQSGKLELPDDKGDRQGHSLEFMLSGLDYGEYWLLVSHDPNFVAENNYIGTTSFLVSDLAYFSRKENKGTTQAFYVVNRTTGAPQEGVKAVFFMEKYNALIRDYTEVQVASGVTDKNGYVISPQRNKDDYASMRVSFSKGNDELNPSNNFYNSREYTEGLSKEVVFFTDRSIYRPGQTIYFKGVYMQRQGGSKVPVLQTNTAVTISFYDANYQLVSKLELKTSEYGSFQGSFVAPSSGLTGAMTLRHEESYQSKTIRVEEYKRPKFEAKFLPVQGAFRLNDEVAVKVQGKAYAGNAIDGAKVQYRVVRRAEFPYWRRWYWGSYNPYVRDAQEIVFGEGMTDANGEFEIKFQALPDRSIPKDQKPQFNYTVYAEITDINGETRTAETVVSVGYIALAVSLDLPSELNQKEKGGFSIKTSNLAGQAEPAEGSWLIEQLEQPKVVYAQRRWAKPDFKYLAEAQFKAAFPFIAYDKEDEEEGWKVLKTAAQGNFNTAQAKEVALAQLGQWAQGRYRLTLKTKDKFGEEIELVRYFTVFDPQASLPPLPMALFVDETNFRLEPGNIARPQIGSSNTQAYILFEVGHDQQVVRREWVQASSRKAMEILVEEKHRGNFGFQATTVQNGRFYNDAGSVVVPFSQKELKIEFSTFRDKLQPGQEEEWRLKISGPKGDKVSAELLASMYDASLDAFLGHQWYFNPFRSSYTSLAFSASECFSTSGMRGTQINWNAYVSGMNRRLPNLNWFGFSFNEYRYTRQQRMYREASTEKKKAKNGDTKDDAAPPPPPPAPSPKGAGMIRKSEDVFATTTTGEAQEEERPEAIGENQGSDFGDVKVRTNLNETVFFMPDLSTDAEGNVIIKFKMNEALTRWKFQAFALSKDLSFALAQKEVLTQKELMVQPNAPRFFREGDKIRFPAKVSNISDKALSGKAILQLFDANTMQPVDQALGNRKAELSFSIEAGRSTPLFWELELPKNWVTPITYRVIAKAGEFSDGEENALPVLTNRMLLTETLPLPVRGKQTKEFKFGRMKELSKSTTLQSHTFTLEFTQNPAWYAVQSLPYLMEYPYECTEQIFSRFYANSLASSVANSHPKIKSVFEQWKNIDTDALKSNLSKNQELKYALLEETPWVLNAQNEELQKKNIGLLFDLNRMGKELEKARDKMAERQLSNGGFAWFPGGRDDYYITQYIVEGMGHMKALGIKDIVEDKKTAKMLRRAVDYIDDRLAEDYAWMKKNYSKEELEKDHLGYMAIHYLYARSFFLDQAVDNKLAKEAIEYYEGQAKKYWKNKGLYLQGFLALALHRKGLDKETPANIVRMMRENSLNSEEMGMYWKYPGGYSWYEYPIETHALMIEVFDEVAKDAKAVDDLKTWLLKAKQTTHWKTTKATAAACYALLLRGDNWLMDDQPVQISLGSKPLDLSQIKQEAGTGYFKKVWKAEEIKPEMAEIKVSNPNNVVAWGAIYWQYFEQMDKVKDFKETPLTIDKKLFKEVKTDRGLQLQPITDKTPLQVGDLVKVRIELRVDRNMEYVHMKDARASGFEPVNVLSQYKYQGGLGYYESTRDAATNFFFSYLSKGTYVFEYGLRVQHAGNFSNGVTTIQCMYAPEFTSHSEGIRVEVKP